MRDYVPVGANTHVATCNSILGDSILATLVSFLPNGIVVNSRGAVLFLVVNQTSWPPPVIYNYMTLAQVIIATSLSTF